MSNMAEMNAVPMEESMKFLSSSNGTSSKDLFLLVSRNDHSHVQEQRKRHAYEKQDMSLRPASDSTTPDTGDDEDDEATDEEDVVDNAKPVKKDTTADCIIAQKVKSIIGFNAFIAQRNHDSTNIPQKQDCIRGNIHEHSQDDLRGNIPVEKQPDLGVNVPAQTQDALRGHVHVQNRDDFRSHMHAQKQDSENIPVQQQNDLGGHIHLQKQDDLTRHIHPVERQDNLPCHIPPAQNQDQPPGHIIPTQKQDNLPGNISPAQKQDQLTGLVHPAQKADDLTAHVEKQDLRRAQTQNVVICHARKQDEITDQIHQASMQCALAGESQGILAGICHQIHKQSDWTVTSPPFHKQDIYTGSVHHLPKLDDLPGQSPVKKLDYSAGINTCKDESMPLSEQKLADSPSGKQHSTSKKEENELCMKEENGVSKKEDAQQHCEDREKSYRQGNWICSEILVLLEAKAKEQSGVSSGGPDRWKNVSEYCRSKGVQRTKEQCKIKWDNMMPEYRKIRDYEDQKEATARSYFMLEPCERRAKLLPSNMDAVVYQRIASILSNKPMKSGSLKREAREKRAIDASSPTTPTNATKSGIDCDGDKPIMLDTAAKLSNSARKRRRRRASETALTVLPELKVEPAVKNDTAKIQDDSSTEDDTPVISCRPQQAPVTAVAHVYAERSSFANHNPDASSYQQRSRIVDHGIQLPYNVIPNGCHNVGLNADRGIHGNSFECAEERGVSTHEHSSNGISNRDMINHIEDRRDARHREYIALEREKLAVFREVSLTIANAMTNAVAAFSKMADELLMHK